MMNMMLPICLIGEDSQTLELLRQQLEREAAYVIDSKFYRYSDAFEALRNKVGTVVAIVDLKSDPEPGFVLAEEIKLKIPNVRLVMTSAAGHSCAILRDTPCCAEA